MALDRPLDNLGYIATLVMDMQNDFCHKDGAFAKAGLDVVPAQKLVPRLQAFLQAMRRHGYLVVYTKQVESDVVSPDNLKSQCTASHLFPVCAPDIWDSDFYELQPSAIEPVIENHTYDPLSNPELKNVLDAHGTRTLIVTGVNTDVCIDTTVRRAFIEGYHILVPRNLVATMNPQATESYLDVFHKFFGTVTTAEGIIRHIESRSRR